MPKKIGNYALGKTIGTGNFSKVKEATNEETNAQVAIKIIDKENIARESQLERQRAPLVTLVHPNIERRIERMQTANHLFVVSELITGGELVDKVIAAKGLDSTTAKRYFRQILMGLHYAHGLGIAHRNLKLEHILLDGEDNAKITGFGESDLFPTGNHLVGRVFPTPTYVAPEVLQERGHNGMVADVWSCGVILFLILAGYHPFDDPNMNALCHKIERGEFRMCRKFSEAEKDLIGKMLIVDPTKRITLDEILKHPWLKDTAIQHSPVVQQCISAHLVPADLVDHCCGFMQPGDFPMVRSTSEDTEGKK